jgi:hypothetical protein
MATIGGSNIVTSGLILSLDAANSTSYPGSGTTWSDLSGNGNNGTLTNGPTFNSANGGSILFDGSNDVVMIPRVYPGALSITSNITTIAWIYYRDVGYTSWMIVIDDMGSSPFTSWCMWIDDSAPSSGKKIATYDNGIWLRSTYTIEPNRWNCIAMSKSGNTSSFYINSIFSNNVTFTSLTNGIYTPETVTGTGIGSHTSNNYPFNGYIANVQVYNKALTASEIQQNYNSQKSRFEL